MTGKELAKRALSSTKFMLPMYLSDLADEDLWTPPVPGANTIGWQLNHLIDSEEKLLAHELPGAVYSGIKAPGERASKAEYLAQFAKVRDATIANLEKLTDADLDRPTSGAVQKYAPTLGDLMILVSNHTLMHAGQFTVLRRKLGKPVLF